MKQLKHFLSFFGFMALSCNLLGQSCYVQFFDGSGYIPSPTEHVQLEGAACNLLQAFPQNMRGSFGVFDCGFYLHNESMPGQFPHFFETAVNMAKAQKEYYLVFGRQTDHTGVNTKIWVALNLPKTGSFACMSELEFAISSDKMYELCNSSLQPGMPSSAMLAEVAAMNALRDIVLHAVECCYVSGLRRAEECTMPLVEEYYKKKFTLKSVSFLNTQPIKDDITGESITAPHWLAKDTKPKPVTPTGVETKTTQKSPKNEKPKPVLYLHQQIMQVNVILGFEGTLPPDKPVLIKGETKIGFSIPSTIATINLTEQSIEINNVSFAQPLPPGVNYFEKFSIEWSVSIDMGTTWGKLDDESKNPLYVILAPSINQSQIQETFYFLGCSSAKGKINIDDVFEPIWNHFASLKIKNASGKSLSYYGDPLTKNTSPVALIKEGVGQCGSFAQLLIGVLRAQGKDLPGPNYVQFEPKKGTNSSLGFLVNKWSFPITPAGSGNLNYPYYNLAFNQSGGFQYDSGDKNRLTWGSFAEVLDEDGDDGQNNANPNPIFENHQVVLFNNQYYDPSYGKVYTSLADLETKAIAGFYILGVRMVGSENKVAFFFKKNDSTQELEGDPQSK